MHPLIERGRDKYGKIKMSVFRSQLWLNIQIHKSTEEVEDKHQSKPESNYRSGMVAVDMVGMPISDHLIDALFSTSHRSCPSSIIASVLASFLDKV